MSPLERVFTRREDQCAFIYAVAGCLGHLNEFASRRRGGALIEYNVGGVAAAIEPLRKLGNEHAAQKMHYTDTNIDELVELLTRAWYIREDGTRQGSRPRSQRDYYNSELDPNGTLGIALAQFLATLEPLVDRSTAMMFSTCGGLLRRYAGFARSGSEFEAHFDEETGDEFYSLLRFFRSLHKMKTLEHKAHLAEAQELRNKGNEVFKMGRFGYAIELYTKALLLDPTNYILYSNRAAAYTYLNSTDNAITDLKQSIGIKNDFETAYSRLGFSYLARGNALESVKAYIRAIELAESNGSLAQYIQKLVESLSYAEQRAMSQGISREELARLSSGIVSIRNRYNVTSRAPTPSGQRQQGAQPTGGLPNQQYQAYTDGTQGVDVLRQAFNLMGNVINPAQQGQQQPQQPAQAPDSDTAAPDSDTGAPNPDQNAQPQQQGQTQFFTSHFVVNPNDPNAPNIIEQALGNMVAGIGQNPIGYVYQNGLNPTGQTQQPVQGQAQQAQPQAQADSQPQPSSGAPASQETHDSTADAGEPMDEDMADPEADPETSVPEPHDAPTPATNSANNQQQQQPRPQSLQNVFLNALPAAMRNTVGPVIIQSLSNALTGGSQGQGDGNGQPTTQTTTASSGTSSSTTTNPTAGSSSNSNAGSEPNHGSNLPDLDLD